MTAEGVPVLNHVLALLAEKDLRDQQRFDAQTIAINAALTAAEKAVSKAETAADKRFELLNELRIGVATREQVEAVEKNIAALGARVDRTEGRGAGLNAGWVYLLGAMTLVSLVVAVAVGLAGR